MKAQTPTPAAAERQYVRLRIVAPTERRPDAPAKLRVGRYSQGAERLPDSPRKLRIGRFSTGIEQRPDAPDKLRRGSFADGYGACS